MMRSSGSGHWSISGKVCGGFAALPIQCESLTWNASCVISGCSGGGKSTLLMELARRGHAVVDEPGRRIVQAGARARRHGASLGGRRGLRAPRHRAGARRPRRRKPARRLGVLRPWD